MRRDGRLLRNVVGQVVASAPGKLILMGEHAVVYGRPGLIGAIDLRLRVSLSSIAEPEVRLDLPAVGERRSLSWPAVLEETRDARDRWRRRFVDGRTDEGSIGVTPGELVALALGETADTLGDEMPPGVSVRVDSDLPVGSGLGSSAALAVAAVGGYLALRGHALDPDRISELALEVERRQHGLPSGVDNVTVLRGGLLWIERTPEGLVCDELEAAAPLLGHLRPYHSGSPSESTGDVVAYVRDRREECPEEVERRLDEIGEATRSFRGELTGSDLDPLLHSIRRCQRALEALGVVPRAVREIVRRIEAEGGAAKISGAGSISGPGAGSVLVFHPEPERISTWPFLGDWRTLATSLPAEGLRMEETA